MPDFLIRKIELCGFRGFPKKQEIEFGHPLTLVSGGNRRGKSSLINAIEWCLFGSKVALKDYGGIRERIGWEITNLNSPECWVQCLFESAVPGKTLVVRRTQVSGKKTTQLWFELQDEKRDTNEANLHALLRISPSDYVRAIHLHSEVLRNLVVALPAERREAIDRLLGLSDLREMVKALEDVKAKSWTEFLGAAMNDLSTRLEVSLRTKKATIDTDVSELKKAGLGDADLSLDGAFRFAAGVANAVKDFAREYELAEVNVATVVDFAGLESFLSDLPSILEALRNQHPSLRNQGELLTEKSTLEGLKKNYEDQLGIVETTKHTIEAIPSDRRELDNLEKEIERLETEASRINAQMQEVSQNATILRDALTYFKARLSDKSLACPVCGETSKTASEWQDHIWAEIAKGHLEPLQGEADRVEESLKSLKEAKRILVEHQERLREELGRLGVSRASIEEKLGVRLKDGDDPVALLRTKIDSAEQALQASRSEVESVNRKLSEFEESVRVLDRLARVAKTVKEMERIESISQSERFKELSGIRRQCEQQVEDLELLAEGLRSVTNEEATKRLSGAQTAIAQTFEGLTGRRDFPGLRLNPHAYTIEVTNSSGAREALPILNQGDLNCAALSIFLALATAPDRTHCLGFVILDDPSQSLDAGSIRNLRSLVQNICDSHQMIICSADDDLRDQILKILKNKRHIVFNGWDPVEGPQISVENN